MRVRTILEWFNAMATDEELQTMDRTQPDDGDKLAVVEGLNELIRRRLAEAFENNKNSRKPEMGKNSAKPVKHAVCLSQLKRLSSCLPLTPNPHVFRRFLPR